MYVSLCMYEYIFCSKNYENVNFYLARDEVSVQLAIATFHIKTSECDHKRNVSYTVDTIEALQKHLNRNMY